MKALLLEKDTSGLKPKFDYSLYESGEGLSTINLGQNKNFLLLLSTLSQNLSPIPKLGALLPKALGRL